MSGKNAKAYLIGISRDNAVPFRHRLCPQLMANAIVGISSFEGASKTQSGQVGPQRGDV